MSRPPARFDAFRARAQRLLEEPGRVQTLAQQATRKLARTGGESVRELRDNLQLAVDMVRAWASGEYRHFSNQTLLIVVAALLYFVVPLDVIPDFIFGWGFVDDAAVLGYVFTQLGEEVEAFKSWREQQRPLP